MKLRITVLVCLLLMASLLPAQSTDPEMADAFRAEGKIYVVVAVCLIVLFGLIAYLTGIDRRLKKLEDMSKKY
ncbi:MAG: CcmD family protein [Thermaurantimonas sp.]